MSFGWLARRRDGTIVIAGGRYAGEPWPNAIPDGTPGRIGLVQCPIISPEAPDVQSSPENRSHADCLDTPSASPMRVQLMPRARRMPT
jgi:hypothetical protein